MNRMPMIKLVAAILAVSATCAAQAADLVAVGAPSAPALTKEQLNDVYLGRNQSLVPFDLPEASPVRADFYKKLTGKDPAQVKALWSRLTFTGKGQPPKELGDAAAVKKAVAADPKAIGYIEKSAVDGSVKVLFAVE
jgi:ABC-type phosphate transport system substrate-binding protein